MKNPIKTFEPNFKGRDFVIGDLHGALPCFERLLKGIEFDPVVDRMFSVGDLIDRGPYSAECLFLLREPWFHSVFANHEQMMREAFVDGYIGAFWLRNGGDWGAEALKAAQAIKNQTQIPPGTSTQAYDIIDMLGYIDELPFIITVNMPNGKKFHIMHAELPPGPRVTDKDLANPDEVFEIGQDAHTRR